MHFNTTTPNMAPPSPRGALPAYYILIPFVGFTLLACAVALVVYIRRRIRLDELRHRLIPMYTYDATEQEEDWGEASDEDEELTEPLYKKGKLSLTSDYET